MNSIAESETKKQKNYMHGKYEFETKIRIAPPMESEKRMNLHFQCA